MKNRSKLMLAATSILTVSIAASATSAFAWYTASRIANIDVTNIQIVSKSANLSIEVDPGTYNDIVQDETHISKGDQDGKTEGTRFEYKLAENKILRDISSCGNSTYQRPKFGPDGRTIVGWYTPEEAAKYAVSFDIKFTATGELGLQLYLRSNSTPSVDSSRLSIDDALRYSFVKQANPDQVVLYANPLGEDTNYLQGSEKGKIPLSGDSLGEFELSPINSNTSTKANLFGEGKYSKEQTSVRTMGDVNTGTNYGCLGYIAPKSTLIYRVNIWVEGTDPECILGPGSAWESDLINLPLNFYAIEYTQA